MNSYRIRPGAIFDVMFNANLIRRRTVLQDTIRSVCTYVMLNHELNSNNAITSGNVPQ